ncbi:MAG: transketolase C-terminal domain-containing protein [Acidimicrobiia bacterium]
MPERTVLTALNDTLREEMRADPSILVLGETVWSGGAAGVTRDLIDEFGERVIETPVSENAIFQAALGLAIAGYRPIIEIYSADFLLAVANEVINDMAKWRAQQGRPAHLPITIRGPMGATGGLGPEHSQCVERYFYHAPGLEVVVPGSPATCAPLLAASIRSNEPTLFLEHRRLYPAALPVTGEEGPAQLGRGEIVRKGSEATVVAWGWMVSESLTAADRAAEQGLDLEVIDLQTVAPMDLELVVESLNRTGRLLTVEEAPKRGGIGGEIVASVSERLGRAIPMMRVGMEDCIHSYHPVIEAEMLPDSSDIEKAAYNLCNRGSLGRSEVGPLE